MQDAKPLSKDEVAGYDILSYSTLFKTANYWDQNISYIFNPLQDRIKTLVDEAKRDSESISDIVSGLLD